MGNQSRDDLLNGLESFSFHNQADAQALLHRIILLLATLMSGKNPDGSDFTLPNLSSSNVTLNAEDIEIGGVEIKDGATDTRAKVKSDGTDNAVVVMQNTQPLPAGAATSANQTSALTSLASIITALGMNHTDETQLHSDIATTLHADLAALLAKLSADPATQTTLAAILAKLITAPATEAKQDASIRGAANTAIGNPTAAATSGQAVPARATRRNGVLRNEHATDAVRIGPGTVSASTGFLLKAGEGYPFTTTAAINAIRVGSNDVPLSYIEEYD
jgi:hypothetical protein